MLINSTCIGCSTLEVRDYFPKLEYLKKGIHILGTQAGTGKSTASMKFILEMGLKVLLVSSNYNLFKSTYSEILNQPNTVYYQGMNRKCFKMDENIPRMKAKKDFQELEPGYVCCCTKEEQKECPYFTQDNDLKDARIVVTVTMLVGKVLKNFEPDIVFVDENATHREDFIFIDKEVDWCLQKLVKIYTKIRDDDYVQEIDFLNDSIPECIKKDPSLLEAITDEEEYFSADGMKNKWLIEDYFPDFEMWEFYGEIWNLALNHLLDSYNGNKEHKKLLKNLLKIKPRNLKGYIKRKKTYKINPKMFSDPFEYQLFKIAFEDEIPVVMLDASFNKERFNCLFENWKLEKGLTESWLYGGYYPIYIYYSEIEKPEIVINHVQPKSKFFVPKDTSEIFHDGNSYNYYYSEMQKTVNKIRDTGKSVGIITNMITERMCFKSQPGVTTGHYRGIRGLNDFQNLDEFITFETPQQPVDSIMNNSERYGYGFQEDSKGNKYIGLIDVFIGIFKRVPEFYNSNEIGKKTINGEIYYMLYEGVYDPVSGKTVKKPTDEVLCKANIHDKRIEKNREGWTFDKELRFQVHEEIYQTIHRARPLISDSTRIWVLSTMPQKIYDEFTVKEMSFNDFVSYWDKKKITADAFREDIRSEFKSLKDSNHELTPDEILSNIAEQRRFMTKKSRQMQPNVAFLKALLSIDDFDIEKLDRPEEHKVIVDFPGIRLEGRYSLEKFLRDFDQYFPRV